MPKIVIYGNGDMAELAIIRFRSTGHEVIACIVDAHCINSEQVLDLPLYPFTELQARFPAEHYQLFIAIGFAQANQLRAERFELCKELGYTCASWISPSARIGEQVSWGENCCIADQVILEPFVSLKDNVNIGSNSVIGHHSELGEHVYLSAGVLCSGRVSVSPFATLGTGAVIKDNVSIGKGVLIGAGVVLQGNALANTVYAAPNPQILPWTARELLT